MRTISLAILLLFAINSQAAAPTGSFNSNQCIDCHQKNNSALITDWKKSRHAQTKPTASCIGCHGKQHSNAAASSRKNKSCINCHGGKQSPLVHSYLNSKHGAILRMEQHTYDWQQPLANANYRAPGCAYCHMHQGNHDADIQQNKKNKQSGNKIISGANFAVCRDCHSPRYINRLRENGNRMINVAQMKFNEASKLISTAKQSYTKKQLQPALDQLNTMNKHLNNVYLGAVHQSPDYQWWHGQPALDGDLLKIKGVLGDLERMEKLK
ncbi:MAG: hypothetical protein IME93_00725 [Proteobacteria bacterium]|nr:hypothetical protein [Pseudomonadota bacterium]